MFRPERQGRTNRLGLAGAIFILLFSAPGLSLAQETIVVGTMEQCPGFELVTIPAGCFQMGSPDTQKGRGLDEGPVHEVCVDAFLMGRYEVTNAQWSWVMNGDCDTCSVSDSQGRRPVENISWVEAVEFIDKLNGKITTGTFRLPTEAEWEYAARGGTTTVFSFGDLINPEIVNYDGNYPYGPTPKGKWRERSTIVGSFPPNAFGLYDMHGNVWEHCSDWYDSSYYSVSPKDNPPGAAIGIKRSLRGGSWNSDARNCRVAERTKYLPNKRRKSFGVRLIYQAK